MTSGIDALLLDKKASDAYRMLPWSVARKRRQPLQARASPCRLANPAEQPAVRRDRS